MRPNQKVAPRGETELPSEGEVNHEGQAGLPSGGEVNHKGQAEPPSAGVNPGGNKD